MRTQETLHTHTTPTLHSHHGIHQVASGKLVYEYSNKYLVVNMVNYAVTDVLLMSMGCCVCTHTTHHTLYNGWIHQVASGKLVYK